MDQIKKHSVNSLSDKDIKIDTDEADSKSKLLAVEVIDLQGDMTKADSGIKLQVNDDLITGNAKPKESSDNSTPESPCATSDGGTDLFISNSEFSSNASTPVPPEPFQPRFKINISPDDVTKDGELTQYTIRSETLCDGPNEHFSVLRTYEDFEWLHHSLSTCSNMSGVIVPPLPPKSQSAIEKSRKQLGNNAKTLLKDEFGKECRKFHRYLTLLAEQKFFGQEEIFQLFLSNKDTPVHISVRKGIFNRLNDAMKNKRYGNETDCDEFFLKERKHTDVHVVAMKSCSDNFDKMVSSQLRFCEIMNHLSTAIILCVGDNSNPITAKFNKLNNLFSRAIKDGKDAFETLSINDETTLGAFLELYTDYSESKKEMLFKRTCLMIEYENSNRAVSKAKANPVKQAQAMEYKKEVEKNFEQCSDVARHEIKRYNRERVFEFQQSLTSYCDARIRNARDTITLLSATMSQIKQLKLPDVTNK